MGLMRTFTGRLVDPLNLRATDVCIADIAHALATINRFGGHYPAPLSVAEHSIRVAQRLPAELRMWGLLHDAAEAYLGDVVRPIKQKFWLDGSPFAEVEHCVLGAIATAMGLEWPNGDAWQSITAADDAELVAELEAWEKTDEHRAAVAAGRRLSWRVPMGWEQAEKSFLCEYQELRRAMTARAAIGA